MSTNKLDLAGTETQKTVYHCIKSLLVKPIFQLYFRGEVIGKEKVPLQGKLIIVSNHASNFDPPLLAAGIPRPISYMAKEELFQQPTFAKLIASLGAYPVNREGFDRRAIKEAITKIREGWAVGIFLDGTRTVDGRIYAPKLGAALIAAKTQAPLLPVCILGTEKILPSAQKLPQPVRVIVKIGDLIEPSPSVKKDQLELVTQKCASVINAMHNP
jgi:1-acyl-sn-glycerol-3-phosphate acyltransferase